mmetsp:Transcript_125937/g.281388  ORF Transcript_125937/g.281388 Transcript_125937/m.281388 type:complete len:224 (+) Transcript_125937:364-1035(+)
MAPASVAAAASPQPVAAMVRPPPPPPHRAPPPPPRPHRAAGKCPETHSGSAPLERLGAWPQPWGPARPWVCQPSKPSRASAKISGPPAAVGPPLCSPSPGARTSAGRPPAPPSACPRAPWKFEARAEAISAVLARSSHGRDHGRPASSAQVFRGRVAPRCERRPRPWPRSRPLPRPRCGDQRCHACHLSRPRPSHASSPQDSDGGCPVAEHATEGSRHSCTGP